jgi:hypothetical protein
MTDRRRNLDAVRLPFTIFGAELVSSLRSEQRERQMCK